jgi:thymidine phosphorylase
MKGRGPGDVMEVTLALGEQMLLLAGVEKDASAARARLERSISSGAALVKFREMVEAQGGDPRVADEPALLPQASIVRPLASARTGFVRGVDAMGVALAALRLGAGRVQAEDTVDPSVGVSHLVKTGETVKAGGALCMIHANSEGLHREAADILGRAIVVGDAPAAAAPLVGELIG